MRILLLFVLGLSAVLAANSIYLGAITFLEWFQGDPNKTYQNWFYMVMFGTHLGLGLLLILPVVIFGILHIKNAHSRPNRRAVKVGYLLFTISLLVLITGLLLTRADVFQFKNLGLKDPRLRSLAYWAHVLTPALAVWRAGIRPLLHRLRHGFTRFGNDRRRRRMVEIEAFGTAQKPWIPADCHFKGGPYIEPNAATHPLMRVTFRTSTTNPCLKSFSPDRRDASKDVFIPEPGLARQSR